MKDEALVGVLDPSGVLRPVGVFRPDALPALTCLRRPNLKMGYATNATMNTVQKTLTRFDAGSGNLPVDH